MIFPASVQIIDSEAFSGCDNLKGVELSGNIISIGDKAFYNCSSIEGNVTIDNTLDDTISGYGLGIEAFKNC